MHESDDLARRQADCALRTHAWHAETAHLARGIQRLREEPVTGDPRTQASVATALTTNCERRVTNSSGSARCAMWPRSDQVSTWA